MALPSRHVYLIEDTVLMKAVVNLLGMAVQTVLADTWPAFGGGRMLNVQAQPQRPEGMERRPQQDLRRPTPPPERRQDSRLTEEERRDLRRDVDRAGREIYKGR